MPEVPNDRLSVGSSRYKVRITRCRTDVATFTSRMQAQHLKRQQIHQGAIMPYDIPLAPREALNAVRSRTQNEVAPTRADIVRPIEPMLLVHQEQVETFRLVAAALRRGLKALARPYAAVARNAR
jgi:hypothetical protein